MAGALSTGVSRYVVLYGLTFTGRGVSGSISDNSWPSSNLLLSKVCRRLRKATTAIPRYPTIITQASVFLKIVRAAERFAP